MKRIDVFNAKDDGSDVQALVRSGFGSLGHGRYFLLRIEDKRLAAAWIHRLLEVGLVKSAADTASEDELTEAVQLAFSHRGLATGLGLSIEAEFPFPTIFARGMAAPERAAMLGDDPESRAAWLWHDADGSDKGADLLLAHYREKPFDRPGPPDPGGRGDLGVVTIQTIPTCPFFTREKVEPFGFRDGLSQPHVPGLHSERKRAARKAAKPGAGVRRQEVAASAAALAPETDPDVLPPGELLLGQLNAYGERSYCPQVVGFKGKASDHPFARNGSYLAVRQIWQDTAALARWESTFDTPPDSGNPTPFERIIGRRRDGTPIRACPVQGSDERQNDFLFRVDDYEGFHCPRGAHIRRGNPRDALGWDSASGVFASRLHRILRRGRVYRAASACDEAGSCSSALERNCGQGLFFIALNADLERQFEFVQRQWLSNMKFADLWQERDVLGGGGEFSMPGYMPMGTRLTGLPRFTDVVGGGYFFLPSLSALRFIAGERR